MGKVSSLTKIQKSYIAGFLDGDGTVMCLVEKHEQKRFHIRIRVAVEFTQHNDNIRILQYLQKVIGGGKIHPSLRNVWKYSIKDQTLVKEFLKAMVPYLFLKKRQIKFGLKVLSLNLLSKRGLMAAGLISNRLSSLNLRSKSRRIRGADLVREAISRND